MHEEFMSKILFSSFALFILAFISISCSTVKPNNKINNVSSVQANNQHKPDNSDGEIKKSQEDNGQDVENNREKSKPEKKIGKCQPENVPRNLGLIDSADMNEIVPKPETREEFNEWLSYGAIGSVQVAEMEGRKYIKEYYGEGDFNADSCADVAVIVQGVEDKTGKKTLEQAGVDVTVENLRTGAVFQGGDVKKLPFTPRFEAQIKPQQEIALVVVLGGENGWSWKHGGRGRTFLLYDSIYQTPKTKDMTDLSTVFGVIEKSKPNQDYDDLLYLFPPNAKGDCIHTELEIQKKGVEYVDASKRNLICFDGRNFFAKSLPNTKLYPE